MNVRITAEAPRGAAAGSTRPLCPPDFDSLFREHAPYVLRLLGRLGVAPADLDDVAQEVFVTVARRLGDFEGRATPRTWIYSIAARHAANYRRGAARARRNFGVPATEPVELPAPTSQGRALEARQGLRVAERLLCELPDPLREVFVLFEIEQLDMADVALIVGCPLFTAYGRLYSARRRVRKGLRQCLGEEVGP